MRVVVATDRFPALTSAQAGAAMAQAWAERRAQVAVVPLGNALEGFQDALASLLAGSTDVFGDGLSVLEAPLPGSADAGGDLLLALRPEHHEPAPGIDQDATSAPVGHLLRGALEQARRRGRVGHVVLEMGDVAAHDGGAGLLAALGATADVPLDRGVAGLACLTRLDLDPARELLDGARLTLVVLAGQEAGHLVGLRGLTSVRGHGVGLDPAVLLATDQALVDLGAAAGGHQLTPGAGAAGGLGHAVLALGGQVCTGAAFCRDLAGLPATMARADLVVTGGGSLDFGTMGGDVLTVVTRAATEALRPVVVVAEQNFISARELRSIGVEAAYSVRPDPAAAPASPVDEAELLAATRPVAATWCW